VLPRRYTTPFTWRILFDGPRQLTQAILSLHQQALVPEKRAFIPRQHQQSNVQIVKLKFLLFSFNEIFEVAHFLIVLEV